jgi:hypothetical protein
MSREVKDSLHAVRILPYDGDKTKWQKWEHQVMLMAGRGHFKSTLTHDLGTLITERQYITKEVEVTATDGTVTTKLEKNFYNQDADAMAFLGLSLTGNLLTITMLRKTAHECWMKVQRKCSPNTMETDLIKLDKEYNSCRLTDKQDPDAFFVALERLNLKLGSVDLKYLKDEMTTKLHILGRLPKEYFAVERKFRNILDTSPIELIKLEITQEYDRFVRNGR